MKETLSYVLPESLFTSVSLGRQGPPLSVSLRGSLKQKYSRLSEVSQLWYRPARLHRLGLCSLAGRYKVS